MNLMSHFSLGRAVTASIKVSGGLRKTLGKPWKLYKREGWPGIVRGFRIVADLGVDNLYTVWCKTYDTMTDSDRVQMKQAIDRFAERPLISVVMPVYNPKPKWIAEAVNSVRKQIYPNWELCIADDASTDKTVRPLLDKLAREDSRIKVAYREKNGHISATSNSALAIATGEWTVLLDHDDVIPEHALFWIAEAINRDSNLAVIYSDEDKIDENGRRHSHYFKCDWNVDLFYSQNLISHLGCYRTSLLREIGGFRVGLEGSQDYDLALRCIERIEPEQVHHIPRVLYHWRSHAESTAVSTDVKPYAVVAGERALNEHFARLGVAATAVHRKEGYRAEYAAPDVFPKVSLLMPTRNGVTFLRTCVESIVEKTDYPDFEILVIDNGSDDPAAVAYLDSLKDRPNVRVLTDDRPFNYSALNNFAASQADGDVLCLVNNDLEVITPGWLKEMVVLALRPGVGAVGARLWYPDDTLQHGGVILGVGGVASHSHKFISKQNGYAGRAGLIQSFSAVTGACLVVRKSAYDEVGGLNEKDLAVAFNDVDFCLRLREAGYRNLWTPYAELYHHESVSRGAEDTPEKQARFDSEVAYMLQRWGPILQNDPAYSPNLTLSYDDFSLAFPPRVSHTSVS